jgi:dolichol-phosphate mannosyltransferase
MLSSITQVSSDLNVLVIDDNSPDRTADLVEEFMQENKNVHLLKREGKLGLGTAYIEGFRYALKNGFNYVFTMDSDFSHDPKELPNLIEAAQTSDLVVGSRYVGGIRIINWPLSRLALSSFASFYVRTITGIRVFDPTSGFNCFTRHALESIDLDRIFSVGYSFLVELKFKIWSRGLKLSEVPIIFYERRDGQSKMSKKIIFESIISVFKLRLKKIAGTL